MTMLPFDVDTTCIPSLFTTIVVIGLVSWMISLYVQKRNEQTRRDRIPRIILWCYPRTRSTAFERCIMQLSNGKVVHEPFRSPYFFGQERITTLKSKLDSHYKDCKEKLLDEIRFVTSNHKQVSSATNNFSQGSNKNDPRKKFCHIKYKDVVSMMTDKSHENNHNFMFFKAMAKFVTKHKICDVEIEIDINTSMCNENMDEDTYYYDYLLQHELRYPKFYHTFLIRNPLDSIVSFYKMLQKLDFDWKVFDINSIGINDCLLIYNKCVELGFENLIIIDSDDLVNNPKEMFKQYCNVTGLDYSDNMLTWDCNDEIHSSFIENCEPAYQWMQQVINSSGFADTVNTCTESTDINDEKNMIVTSRDRLQFRKNIESKMPKHVQKKVNKVIEISNQSYKILHAKRLVV